MTQFNCCGSFSHRVEQLHVHPLLHSLSVPRSTLTDTTFCSERCSITLSSAIPSKLNRSANHLPTSTDRNIYSFFLYCCLPLYQQLVHKRQQPVLLDRPFCRALLKQPALPAFGLFYISSVAQTGLSRPQDTSHHFWNYISGWFISLFVKSGDSTFTHLF